jgi:sacsin
MTPDRAQLHGIGDKSIQYPLPGEWNHWLFEELIPTAWTNLLVYLAQQYPDQSAFGIWPKPQEDTNNILYHIDEKVLRIIEQKNYSVWYTDLGYVTLGSGLVTKIEKSSVMRKALNDAGVPVIYLPGDLMSSVETTYKVKSLRPQTLCGFLERRQDKLRIISEDAKQVLLDYVISDPNFREYGAVELFPFEDGIYRAIDNEVAFIHRDDEERLLFQLENGRNIELRKLSKTTQQLLQNGCSTSSLHSSLRHRSTYDLKTYCLKTHFKTFDSKKDLVSVDENISIFISRVWNWIVTRQHTILDDNISCLWLLPLSDGRYRKIKPSDASFDTIYAGPGELGDFLRDLDDKGIDSNKPIIKTNGLSSCSVQLLIDAMKKDPSLFIKTSDILENFMHWLSEIREVFDDMATDDDRWRLHKLLASRLHLCIDLKTISNILGGLKVFQKVVWKAENDDM